MGLLVGVLRRVLILALVLAIPVVAGELIARKLIADAVTSAVRARIGVAPDVSLGSAPILLQLIRGRIDAATLRARGARIGGLPPVALTATLHDVHVSRLTSLQGAIGWLSVDARLTPSAVRELLVAAGCIGSLPPTLRGALTSAPRVVLLAGRIDLLPPAGRAVEVRLRPAIARDTVVFEPSGVELRAAAAGARPAGCAWRLRGLPFGVALVSASARPGALALDFSGGDATFSALG